MARIRTVKPDLFKHEGLFDAEVETGFPLRIAFIGLFTVCDKAGRFAWRPRALKTDVMPYDEVDFSRVLDALVTRGFVVKYRVGDDEFGAIPSWSRHQVLNNRETESEIPQPAVDAANSDASSTRDQRVEHAALQLQRGREGKGREEEGKEEGRENAPTEFAFVGKVVRLTVKDFDRWRTNYARVPNLIAELTKADDYYAENPPKDGKWFFPVSKWLAKANDDALAKAGGKPQLRDRNGLTRDDPMFGVA